MPKVVLEAIKDEVTDVRKFMNAYNRFMKKWVKPGFMGQDFINFSMEVTDKGYRIVAESNRALNNASFQALFNLTRGFLGGYLCSQDIMKENKPDDDQRVQS